MTTDLSQFDINDLPDPEGIKMVPFPRDYVEAVDSLIQLAKNLGCYSKRIETEADWTLLEAVITFWARMYPEEYDYFKRDQATIRSGAYNRNASARDAGGAEIQHQMNMPENLYKMIKIFFHKQKWDKKMVSDFARRWPLFKVPESRL